MLNRGGGESVWGPQDFAAVAVSISATRGGGDEQPQEGDEGPRRVGAHAVPVHIRAGGRWKIQLRGGDYVGVFDSLKEAKETLATRGVDLVQDRTKREDIDDYIEKARFYFDWVVGVGFEPADLTVHREYRKASKHLVRAAPCVYQIAVEGKEGPWWQSMVRAHERCSVDDKLALLQLTSDVEAEFMKAAAIQHRIYCEALRSASRPAFHKERAWWAAEVQHNVGMHMGWLAKAQSMGVLKKPKKLKKTTRGGGAKLKKQTRGGGVNVGQRGCLYRAQPLTVKIARRYKVKAVLTTTLAAMQTPMDFQQYRANRDALLALPSKYHDLWYFRSFFEIERELTFGTCDMPLPRDTTVEEFTAVFPDSVGHLQALATHYGAESVAAILQRLGYSARKLPVSMATMHLCFAGQLWSLEVAAVRRVLGIHLKRATKNT